MKERIKGAFTKKKIFHFLKMALFVVVLSLILLSLLGTVAHATGLVDDTINAENLYSKYPLSNYQLDFYVDNSWSWLPWNWLDGIGKSVQYGILCRFSITDNFNHWYLCCLYGTDKKRNQQSGSSGYQFSCGVRIVRFIYCLRSRLHQEDK